jgi:hypothetical protein
MDNTKFKGNGYKNVLVCCQDMGGLYCLVIVNPPESFSTKKYITVPLVDKDDQTTIRDFTFHFYKYVGAKATEKLTLIRLDIPIMFSLMFLWLSIIMLYDQIINYIASFY